jgi:hypothetical protein
MSGYFGFGWESPAQHQFRFLFKAHGTTVVETLSLEIKRSVQRVPFPDVISIICSDDDYESLIAAFEDKTVSLALRRLSSRTQLYVVSFDHTGSPINLERIGSWGSEDDFKPDIINNFNEIKKQGIKALFESKEVVVPAPAGFRFRKPSGDYSTHFIRAEEALSDSESVEFLAFCLLERISHRSVANQALEVIFVDTMAIASVAYALRQTLVRLGQNPRIESFHSHEGIEMIQAPVPGTAFCIISASSSMSLQRKWKEHVECDDCDVVTLVTLAGAIDEHLALFAYTRPVEWKSGEDELPDLQDLQIFGERFQPQQMPIKKAKISLTVHDSPTAKAIVDEYHDLDVFRVNKRSGEKIRALWVDAQKFIAGPQFTMWLQGKLAKIDPSSVQAIVYQGDDARGPLVFRAVYDGRRT